MEKVCLGKIVKLHGYMGQVKVATSYDKDFNILNIEKIYDGRDNEYPVTKIFRTKDGVVVGLEGVDLETAKKMINSELFIDRALVQDKILIEDLKNSDVSFENGEVFAKVTDVQDYGSAEVFYLKTNEGKEVLFPNVLGVIISFDYTQKRLVLCKKRFEEVSNEN